MCTHLYACTCNNSVVQILGLVVGTKIIAGEGVSLDSERVVHSCEEHTHSSIFGFHGEHTYVGGKGEGIYCSFLLFVVWCI